MRTEVLLKVQEGNLHVSRGGEKVAKLLVKDKNATVVGVFEAVFLDVSVNSASYKAAGNKLTLLETEELSEFIGNLLLTVEAVVLSAVSRLFTVGVVLLSLNLSNDFGKRLKIRTEGGDFGKNGFNSRHCILYTQETFKYITI